MYYINCKIFIKHGVRIALRVYPWNIILDNTILFYIYSFLLLLSRVNEKICNTSLYYLVTCISTIYSLQHSNVLKKPYTSLRQKASSTQTGISHLGCLHILPTALYDFISLNTCSILIRLLDKYRLNFRARLLSLLFKMRIWTAFIEVRRAISSGYPLSASSAMRGLIVGHAQLES